MKTMSNGDKLIASILELEKIKRMEKQEQEKQVNINNLIIESIKKQIERVEKQKQESHINNLIIKVLNKQIKQLINDNKNIMKGWV